MSDQDQKDTPLKSSKKHSAPVQTSKHTLCPEPVHPSLRILVKALAREAAKEWFLPQSAGSDFPSNDNETM